MPKITKPLTDTEIRKARPKDREFNLADGKGLYLRVKPNGSKLWIFNYSKPFSKKRANISLGQYPDLSLEKARKQRVANQKLLAENIDPREHRLEQERIGAEAHSNTLKSIAKDWFQVKRSKVTHSYAEDIWRSLELHVFPDLGNMPLHKIKAPTVIDVLKPIAAKGSLETIKRLCQRLNEIMVYAVNTGIIEVNRLAGIRSAFNTPPKRHMPTISPDQLPELMHRVANANIKKTTRCLLEWQLHTMTRPSEAAGTRWEEIDLENGLWHISAERMKKKRAHTVPLTLQTRELLEIMKPVSGHREHLFPADRNPREHAHQQTVNMALKRMGYSGQLVAHGLRALASTTLNEKGFDPDVIESALAHVDKNEVRATYNRAEYLERRKVMMTWWSARIVEAGVGNLSLSSGKKQLRSI
ncbi:MAG: integrase [Gammaproteobacteria bacterium]|nr:integrase [Gammaproteobacteria bacterium]|tara:strand:+ start:182863 stop:184104 length:1242 start_codon:yes stop_codon:yes gene_type:complete